MTRILQTPKQVSRISNFEQTGNGQAIAVTATSQTVAFEPLAADSASTDILLFNGGSNKIFVAFGLTSAVTAVIPTNGVPANGLIIAPSAYLTISKGSNLYIAAITDTATSTLYFYQGYGS